MPGQESVWTYPRPAIAQACPDHLRIEHAGRTIADTRAADPDGRDQPSAKLLHPARRYRAGLLRRAGGRSFCEWKGEAIYWDVLVGDLILPRVGWSYPDPTPGFAMLRDHVAFYAGPFDLCTINGERVTPQARPLLRRLDHGRGRRPVQGRTRNRGLVIR
jgi:uncharacterized protein (DUF427 family)